MLAAFDKAQYRHCGTPPTLLSAGPPPLSGNAVNLRKKNLPSRPKGFPLRGSCLRSRLKRCPRYTSFVYSDRRSYPSGDTSSDPLRGPPSPPRGRLLETAQLKLMTLPFRQRRQLKESLYQQTERLRTVAAVLKDSLRVAICCHREDGMATDSRRYGGFGNHNAKLTVLPFNGRYRA